MSSYDDFIASKSQRVCFDGFDPLWIPEWLKPFQRHLCDWSIRKGRSCIMADCGLGKTPMEFVWAENVHRHTNRPVLILTPLAVAYQMKREAKKFDIDAEVSRDGIHRKGIVITNYEKLKHFNPRDFAGVVCDEASAIKSFTGKRKAEVTEFMRDHEYRLLASAMAAPNDVTELGTASEAIGELGYRDMIKRFFKEDTVKDFLGWGRKAYRLRGWADVPYWRWVCSWAMACRKPSDIDSSFDDSEYVLPPLIENEHVIETSSMRPGFLFPTPARGLKEQRVERRVTMQERCEYVANLASDHDGPVTIWCHLNPEGDMLEKMISGSKQLKGGMKDEAKEEILYHFANRDFDKLILKPKIGAWGLNWQHCHKVITFPSHSFEQYYQLIHRHHRFGQEYPVEVDIVTTEGETAVLKNLQDKAAKADAMFDSLVREMHSVMQVQRDIQFNETASLPAWT